MKILEGCFRWSLDPCYVDLMERLQYGGIIGTQRMPPSYLGHNAGCTVYYPQLLLWAHTPAPAVDSTLHAHQDTNTVGLHTTSQMPSCH